MEYKKSKKVKVKPFRKKKKCSEQDEIGMLQSAYNEINPEKIERFDDFPLSFRTLKGLKENNYLVPTEIQKESIGYSLKGEDVLGAAKTGRGKTLAFLIPVLEILYCKRWSRLDGVGALVITPTRELAYQIFETLKKIGKHHDFSAGLIIGGKDLKFETKRMDQCNIVICTPGRILQHMDENPLFDCSTMQVLVLDEADRCLDMGFERTMNSIIENLPPQRQTLLFSATQTKSVRDLARLSLKDPHYISVHEDAKYCTPTGLVQSYMFCELHDKMNFLWSFIKNHKQQKILVFLSSCKQVKYMYEALTRLKCGVSLMALYGTLHQQKRMAIYDSFCRKLHAVLLATDIAARGLDFPEVNWVIQLDCPESSTEYIHRAGRTARYQKSGESLLVLLPSERKMLDHLKNRKIPIEEISVNNTKLQSVQRSLEASLARDPNLKASAQRAFVAYVKSVFLMKDKEVFNVSELNTDLFARSLGLAIPPRIRFLQKRQKQEKEKEQSKKKNSDYRNANSKIEDIADGSSSQSACADTKTSTKSTGGVYNFYADGEVDDEEDEFLKVKRLDHELDVDLTRDVTEHTQQTIKHKAVVTRAAVAKKMMKKKILPNKKMVFDEEGQVIPDRTREYVSEMAREYALENEGGGIDIEQAQRVLKEEDKYDKELFREKVKQKHKDERKKQKAERKRKHEEEDESSDGPDLSFLPDPDKVYKKENKQADDSEEEYDSSNSVDLSFLPDPETVYKKRTGEPSASEDSDEDVQDNEGEHKRRKNLNGVKKKKKMFKVTDSEEPPENAKLHCDEELALQLMNLR